MFWIFALGIVTLCVYSRGFRRFAIGAVVVILCAWGIAAGYVKYQDNARLAQEAEQTKMDAVKYASCGNEKPFDAVFYSICAADIDAHSMAPQKIR